MNQNRILRGFNQWKQISIRLCVNQCLFWSPKKKDHGNLTGINSNRRAKPNYSFGIDIIKHFICAP